MVLARPGLKYCQHMQIAEMLLCMNIKDTHDQESVKVTFIFRSLLPGVSHALRETMPDDFMYCTAFCKKLSAIMWVDAQKGGILVTAPGRARNDASCSASLPKPIQDPSSDKGQQATNAM